VISNVISEKCRDACVAKLIRERKKLEGLTGKLAVELNSLKQRKDEFDKDSGEFYQEGKRIQCRRDSAFARLKKVNIRIDVLEKGTFSRICPGCRENIKAAELRQNPLRDLCVKCQEHKNKNTNNMRR